MKTPLRYQITEFDCGTTTFLNALSYLFKRKEIPAEIIKGIFNYTLDQYNEDGTAGNGGTSRIASLLLTNWLNNFSYNHCFNLHCEKVEGKIVNTDFIKEKLKKNTVMVVRLWSIYEHYVLVTKIDDEYVYLFDPYYDRKTAYDKDSAVEFVFKNQFEYNRKVKLERLNDTNPKKDYALGKQTKRECIIMRRIKNGTNGKIS